MTAASSMTARSGSSATSNDSEALGIIIIHQELALIPLLSIAENIFIASPPSRFGVIDRDAVLPAIAAAAGESGAQRGAGYADHQYRGRQAAAGGDRQGNCRRRCAC